MRYQFTTEQKAEIEEARRKNKEKRTEKRLLALSLRADGMKLEEVAMRTGFQRCSVSVLIRKYFQGGLAAIVGNHCGGNHRNMSMAEETALLEAYRVKAEQGHMLDVRELELAYEERVGHRISSGQIYRVLKRHGWRKVMPRSKHPNKASEEDIASSKKIKTRVEELKEVFHKEGHRSGKVRLMFQDEAGFGRINKPKYCWCRKGIRPDVPCHHIREYRYAYGAVEPCTGDSFFLVLPQTNTVCMNLFLRELGRKYKDDILLLVCDGASWHTSKTLDIPENMELFFLPPATPEMNPIEQIWKELRLRGFRNEVFASLELVVDRLCDTICSLTNEVVKSITCRSWISCCFY